jgi:hypothetical protein
MGGWTSFFKYPKLQAYVCWHTLAFDGCMDGILTSYSGKGH